MITKRYIYSFHDKNKIRTMRSTSVIRFDPWFSQQYIGFSFVSPIDPLAKYLAHSLHTSVAQENHMRIYHVSRKSHNLKHPFSNKLTIYKSSTHILNYYNFIIKV